MKFTCNLHAHSDYSLHDGFAKIPDMVFRAKELDWEAIALTDHGTVTGLIDFYQECKKENIKPILGCEFYLCEDASVKGGGYYHLILLARDIVGFRNLMKLDTLAHKNFYKKPRIDLSILKEHCEGLICTTACVAGPLSSEGWEEYIDSLSQLFKDDFYVEFQPHSFEEQVEYNEEWWHLSEKTKPIISLDSHYVNKEDTETHRQWLMLGDDSEYYGSGDYHMWEEDEIREWFKKNNPQVDVDLCFKNVHEIVEKCNVEIEFGGQHYPVFIDDPEAYIRKRCNEGYKEKGISGHSNKKAYIDQVKHELEVLRKLGYFNYFCIIDDLLKWCRENGVATGLGRGSVSGSCVAYLMGITKIDPIANNLIFERFANPERVTPADIDIDVSTPDRGRLIEYIESRYGEVYQVRTTSFIKEKSAVQRAGQALGIEPKEILAVSKNLNSLEDMKDGAWKDLAMKFRGHIISYGCHASAVLVAPDDINIWSSVEKQKDNMVVCHDYHQLEAQGLLKLDILGLETCHVIEATLEREDLNIEVQNIPMDDKETAKMLQKGDTLGCFQIESNVMTPIVSKMRVKNASDLSAVVALGRPGPLDSGMVDKFLSRRNGRSKVTYDIPDLEPILKETEGVIVYQEQIMSIARKLCDYTMGEADNLRRIIGRKIVEEMEPALVDMTKRAVMNGYDKKKVEDLIGNITAFANYCMNKSHAAAYGMTAWVTAYLKCHYPAAYMASLIDSNCKDKAKVAEYVLYCKERGIKVLLPTLRYKKCYSTYDEDGPIIILGLNCIAGVGNAEIPKDAPEDFKEFMEQYVSMNKKVIEGLIRAGVFKGNRDEMIQYVSWAKDKRKSKGEFQYIPTDYDNKTEESKVIGVSFGDLFEDYNTSLVDNVRIFAYEVLEVKGRKTKTGKPMAFVKVRNNTKVDNLVIFNGDYKKLSVHKVYIFRLSEGKIMDFKEASKKK